MTVCIILCISSYYIKHKGPLFIFIFSLSISIISTNHETGSGFITVMSDLTCVCVVCVTQCLKFI